MGCSCCSMIKSYIYDPTDPVEVNGLKQDPTTNSLVSSYQCHLSDDRKKQGFHNLGYTSNSNLSKSDIENNHINQARSNVPQTAGGNASLYILQPDGGSFLAFYPWARKPINKRRVSETRAWETGPMATCAEQTKKRKEGREQGTRQTRRASYQWTSIQAAPASPLATQSS
ncbi:hypothetical protein HF521_019713 [Silurus meridionalis]|uniref:Uncharacterized protein n=1 Tax=Silurus meridionalis TaxID=175797 RepID=A0A8T0BHC2_SILME|nr:hypothetical protein HF521_019713 [Silurus meridionalis]